jgi:short-subunit dehydrogenase
MKPVAVVTGASRGIGRAVALRLADTHDIVALARSVEPLMSLVATIRERGGACSAIAVDLRRPGEVVAALDGIAADVLVNNAGVMHKKPFLALSPGEWHEMIDVNINALYHVTRGVLPGMVQRGRGHVINIASIAGRSAFTGGSGYAASKHFVLGFTESLMLEVREHGVKVSAVMPGSVATGMLPPGTDTSWMLMPEDVAECVAQVVATPAHALVFTVEVRASQPRSKT